MDRNSAGFVYLRFENSQSAMDAQRALNGRWFAGKMIGATFMVNLWLLSFTSSVRTMSLTFYEVLSYLQDIPSYEAKFPDSR